MRVAALVVLLLLPLAPASQPLLEDWTGVLLYWADDGRLQVDVRPGEGDFPPLRLIASPGVVFAQEPAWDPPPGDGSTQTTYWNVTPREGPWAVAVTEQDGGLVTCCLWAVTSGNQTEWTSRHGNYGVGWPAIDATRTYALDGDTLHVRLVVESEPFYGNPLLARIRTENTDSPEGFNGSTEGSVVVEASLPWQNGMPLGFEYGFLVNYGLPINHPGAVAWGGQCTDAMLRVKDEQVVEEFHGAAGLCGKQVKDGSDITSQQTGLPEETSTQATEAGEGGGTTQESERTAKPAAKGNAKDTGNLPVWLMGVGAFILAALALVILRGRR